MGINVVVPLDHTASRDTIKLSSRGVAMLTSHAQPDHFPAEMAKAKRKTRAFIEWLRNERNAAVTAPFSVCDHPGAPMACPGS